MPRLAQGEPGNTSYTRDLSISYEQLGGHGLLKTITGRFAGFKLYLYYAISPLRPGIEVPTFREPREFNGRSTVT